MITFTKPANLNGSELRQELRNAGVEITDDLNSVVLIGNDLILNVAKSDETKAAAVVAAHRGTTEPTDNTAAKAAAQAKLAALGLTTDDLKALGL